MSNHDDPKLFHASAGWWTRLKPLARQMRHEPTSAEQKLWNRIRNRQIGTAKFRRQYTIDRFIVDFVCLEHRLIIEVDGDIHDQQQEHDAVRQEFLESLGFRMIRFSNGDVLGSLEAVAEAIGNALESSRP